MKLKKFHYAVRVFFTPFLLQMYLRPGATERMRINSAGNVGIGNNNPTAKLDVAGAIRTSQVDNTGSTAINWASGNVQYTTDSCGAFTFTNLLDGGSYTFAVQGATSAICTFSQAGLTFKFTPANAATTVSTHTVYSMIRAGNYVYVSWVSGL